MGARILNGDHVLIRDRPRHDQHLRPIYLPIDNREVLDAMGRLPPRPMGYQVSIRSDALAVFPTVM